MFFDALAEVRNVGKSHGLTMAEIAFRWVSHHSLLRREHGDAVIIGGSKLTQIEEVRMHCTFSQLNFYLVLISHRI